jgi:predicted transcriptional regulator of viral defense system
MILDTNNAATIRNYLSRAKEKWLMNQIYYGVWRMKDVEVDIFELACKMNTLSYISFETVLKSKWVIFQYYETIFLASNKSIEKIALNTSFKSCKLKNAILLNPLWVEHRWTYSVATLERAICDRIYLTPWYYFDNLSQVDWKKLIEISQIYNKRVMKEVLILRQKYA